MRRVKHMTAAALLVAGVGLTPAVAEDAQDAQTATENAPYQTDEQWLNSAADAEDYASGDVREYRGEVRQAARDLASGEIDREEYWEEIRQAKALLGPDDDHGSTNSFGYGYGYGSGYYDTDGYGDYDSDYDLYTDDPGWDSWYGDDFGFDD